MKSLKIIIVFVFFGLIFISSCVVNQEIHFNDDFSGSYKFTYDFSEYLNVISRDATIGVEPISNDDFSDYINNLKNSLSNISGISNLNINNNASEGILSFDFDFENVESLNKSLIYASLFDDEAVEIETPKFQVVRNKLFYTREPIVFHDDESYDNSLNQLILYNIIINFESPPKKFEISDDPHVKVEDSGMRVIEHGNLNTISEKSISWEFCFRRWFCF